MTSMRAMVEGCPRMKALSDFLAAGPCDSDRKWDAYLAVSPDLACSTPTTRSTNWPGGDTGAASPSRGLCAGGATSALHAMSPRTGASPLATRASASPTIATTTGRATTARARISNPAASHDTGSRKAKSAAEIEAVLENAFAALRAEWKAAAHCQRTSFPEISSQSDGMFVDFTSASIDTVCINSETAMSTPMVAADSLTPDTAAGASASTTTVISTMAITHATSISGDIDIVVQTPTTCSMVSPEGDTHIASPLGGRGAASAESDTVFTIEALELTKQVWMSPSTPTAASTCSVAIDTSGILVAEVFLAAEDMFRMTPQPSEVLTIQPLRLFADHELHMPTLARCLAKCLGDDIDPLLPVHTPDMTLSIKRQGQVLRPMPWPSFDDDQAVCCPAPCRSVHTVTNIDEVVHHWKIDGSGLLPTTTSSTVLQLLGNLSSPYNSIIIIYVCTTSVTRCLDKVLPLAWSGVVFSFLVAELLTVCSVQFHWEIAWFLVGLLCGCPDLEGSGNFTRGCAKLFGSCEELISVLIFSSFRIALQLLEDALKWYPAGIFSPSLPPAKPPDNGTCGFLMVYYIWMSILLIGVLIVWTHFTKVQIIEKSTEMSSWIDAISSVDQTIQCGFEPVHWKIAWLFSLQLVASWFQCYHVVCLAWVWEQQGSTTVKVATCYPQERSYRAFKIPIVEQKMLTRHVIQCAFQIIQWEIAWSLHMGCSGGNKYRQPFSAITLIHEVYLEQSSATALRCFAAMQAPWDHAGLTSCPSYFWNSFEVALVIDYFLQALVSLCLSGYAIHCGSEVMHLIIASIFSHVLLESEVQFYSTEKCFIYDSAQFQWHIAWSTMKISDVGDKFVQFFFAARRYSVTRGDYLEKKVAANLQYCTAIQRPWDTGGSPRCRLGDKPNFKGGGLSATLYHSWAGQWAAMLGLGPRLDIQEKLVQIGGGGQ